MPGFLGVAAFVVSSSMVSPSAFTPPSEASLFSPAGLMLQAGLTPATLAAAGVGDEGIESCFSEISGSGACTTFHTLFMTLAAAETPQARSDAAAAIEAARLRLREDLFAVLPSECESLAVTIAAGTVHGLPTDVAAAVCSGGNAADAGRVKRLLIAEQRAHRMGRQVDERISGELAALRALPVAVAARSNLAANLAEVDAAFADAWRSEIPPH